MKKVLLNALIVFYIIIPAFKIRALEINSNNAVLYNLNDDEIIYEKNLDEKVKVASLTKIMTTILALENIDDIKEEITMPQEAFIGLEGYVVSGIRPNAQITYEDLLYGTMLPSAADCANALAIKISGSKDKFVELMNQKAQELNMTNTHFSNPVGEDEDNYSTVKDISILLKYALNNEKFYEIFTTREYTTSNNIMLESTIIEKSRPYNIDVTNILGSKTGFTDQAGNCLASIAKINNINYLLITTNARTEESFHIMDAIGIYDYFSKNYSYKRILKYNQYIETLKIKNSIRKEYNLYVDSDKYMYLKNDIDINDLIYEYEGIDKITKDTNQNEKIGTIKVKYKDNVLYTYDVYIHDRIQLIDIKLLVTSVTIVLISLMIIRKKKKLAKQQKEY